MTIDTLRGRMPEYAKDIKLNLGRVLAADGTDGLTPVQSKGVGLASAYATKNDTVIDAITQEINGDLPQEAINAAKAAATIMGMNNVYYRFIHLVNDADYATMPANIRMNIIANPGIEKSDFELMSLGVSAINGCGMCIEAHVAEVTKAGISRQGVQTTIRIAAVLNAAAQALRIESHC